MALFKNIHPKMQDDTIVEELSHPIVDNYEREPIQAAWIVNDSLEKGEYSQIRQKLGELPSTKFRRIQYVFEPPETILIRFLLIICVCFIIAYLYFAVMGIGMQVYSEDYDMHGMFFLASTIVVCVINLPIIIRSIKFISFVKRYKKYFELMKYKNVEIIDDICTYTDIPYSRVVKDLSLAVKQKLIPQGHFTTEDLAFIVSDGLFKKYEENKPIYDRYYKQIIEERVRMGERSDEIQRILDIGQEYIDKIHDSNRLIDDKDISLKLDQMERIVATIFREVDLNPEQSGKLGMFLNYYLPTTEKLLTAYIVIDEKEIEGRSIRNAKKDIEHAIDMLTVSFEGILNQFYEEQELDVASDVSAMEVLINQERMQNG